MKVALLFPYYAHYRAAVIDQLSKDKTIEYHFLGGTDSTLAALKLIDMDKIDNFHWVKNRWLFKHFLIQWGIYKIIKREKFDAVVVFADWKYLSLWPLIWYLDNHKVPILFWSHGILAIKNSLNNQIKKLFFKQFKHGGFVYDLRAKNLMRSIGYSNQIEVIYNSLDADNQFRILAEVEAGPKVDGPFGKSKYVIFSGRLIEQRRLDLLFEALRILKDRGTIINGLIVGDGPQLEALKNCSTKLQLNNQIYFYGSCYDEKLLCSLFMGAQACVFPGPLGLSGIHSLTYGLPVITNDDMDAQKPEIEAIIEGVTGMLFKCGDAASLADKIHLISNITDIERQKYRDDCIAIIKSKFNAKNQVSILNKRILKILNS